MRALVVTLSAAVGLLVGLRGAMAVDVSGAALFFLRPSLLPVEGLGLEWSRLAVFPAEVQQLGVERLMRTVAGMAGAAVLVATLNVATMLAEGAGARGRDFAIRAAHGARTFELVRMLLLELRVLVLGAMTLGVPAGLGLGFALRAAWPGPTTSPFGAAPADLLAGLLTALTAAGGAHCLAALRSTRPDRLAAALRSGGRAGWDPAAVFVRRTLSAAHVALAGTVVVTAWALAGGSPDLPARSDNGAGASVHVIPASASDPEAWTGVRAALARRADLPAGSLSTPGALLGLGVRDMTVTECGVCRIGDLPVPLMNLSTEVHAVDPGFFELAGIDVLEGRTFLPDDDGSAGLVALVSRKIAGAGFEGGRALGKRLRVGDDVETWYTVVGIVEERALSIPGEDGAARGAVYLSALQRVPGHGRYLLAGNADEAAEAAAVMEGGGLRVGTPQPLDAYIAEAGAPVGWAALAVRVIGLLVVLLGGHGVYLAALQTTRRRARDMALRSALGAPPLAIGRAVVSERLRTTGWGIAGLLFLGTAVSAALQKASGAPAVGPGGYAIVSLAACLLVLAASVRAVREALAVEPAQLLD